MQEVQHKFGIIMAQVSYPILTNSNCLKNNQLIAIYKWQNDNVSEVFCFFLQHYIDLFPGILQTRDEANSIYHFLKHIYIFSKKM